MTFETTFLPAAPEQEQAQVPERVPQVQGEQAAELRQAGRVAVQAALSFHSRPEQRSRRIRGPL